MNNILLLLRETDKHIFYSPEDDLCALNLAGPREELFPEGDGYLYQEKDGDNR